MFNTNNQAQRNSCVGYRTRPARGASHARFAARALTSALWLLAICPVKADEPMTPPTCAIRLSLGVTPDVPNPSDSGFLSSLLGDHPEYQLFLLSRGDDTHVNLQLQGPGPIENCRAVVASMRNDGRVQSIEEN
jgi:hypothetical protein